MDSVGGGGGSSRNFPRSILTAVTDPQFALFKHLLCFARIISTLCPNLCRQTARIGGGAAAPPAPRPVRLWLHDHMVNYEKAAYSSCHGLRYHFEGPCSHYVVLQLVAGARDVLEETKIRWGGGSGTIVPVNCNNRPSIRVIQTFIVFCPNNLDSLPEIMSANSPNWGGGTAPPPVPYAYAPVGSFTSPGIDTR